MSFGARGGGMHFRAAHIGGARIGGARTRDPAPRVFGNRAIANVALRSQVGGTRFHGGFFGSAWPWWRGKSTLQSWRRYLSANARITAASPHPTLP